MSSLPQLTDAQRAAVERLDQSLAVTSGAGCGKTLVLATRLTELILGSPDLEPFDRFVALTFTEKAASEMTARVRRVLLERLKVSHGQDRQKLAQWIMELPAAHISTIHSFCSWLLRKHAIEAGIDPAFEVLADALLKNSLQTQAAQEAVLSALQEKQADALELLGIQEYARVCQDLVSLLNHPLYWRAEDYADPDKTLARWQNLLTKEALKLAEEMRGDPGVAALLDKLARPPCTAADDKLLLAINETLPQIRAMLALDAKKVDRDHWFKLAKPGNVGSKNNWLDHATKKEYRDSLIELVRRCNEVGQRLQPLGEADRLAAQCLKALTSLGQRAKGLYAQQKRRAGRLDFEDLIELTGKLLRENQPIKQRLRDSLSQMLIDECQDTDGYQLLMLWQLICDPNCPPPPGRLFIVGDAKQSIYRFRGAQAEVFDDLCRLFGDNRQPLTESFRTHRSGVEFVNHIFGRLMKGYESMLWKRPETPEEPSVEFLLAECPGDAKAADLPAIEAELIAQRLEEMIGREKRVWDRQEKRWRAVRPRDVAILFARTTNWLVYERALQQREIPYYTVAGGGFFRQQEIYDVLNALEAVENPYNDIALFGMLRGGMIGLDDNALVRIALHSQRPYFAGLREAAAMEGLHEPQRRQAQFCIDLIARLHAQKDALGPAGVIDRLMDETGFAASLLCQFHGTRRLANVQRLLETARSAESSGLHGLADFVRQFRQQVMEEPRFEQAAVLGEDEDVVRLMTIHKAKGLEFPVVIIPDLNRVQNNRRDRLLYRGDWNVTYKVGEEDDEPLTSEVAWKLETRQLEEEEIRKLYVAITRHEDYLVLVGGDMRKDDGFKKGCYLRRLDDALGGQVSAAAQASTGAVTYGAKQEFRAAVRKVKPTPPERKNTAVPFGRKLVQQASDAARLAAALGDAGRPGKPAELPLVGPLPPGGAVAGTFAATALGDFEHCPRLFHWRYELRVPTNRCWPPGGPRENRSAQPTDSARPADLAIDPATAGTIFHGCMERLDFSQLGKVDHVELAGRLLLTTTADLELDVNAEALATELAAMLDLLAASDLAKWLTGASAVLKELAFVLSTPGLNIAGQIDLLLRDAEGAWRIVDYKSDRLEGQNLADHAGRYGLQMQLYMDAAGRHLANCGQQGPLADAALYFLRTGQCWRIPASEASGLSERLAHLAGQISACRRSGLYPAIHEGRCSFCPYSRLCR